MHVSTLGKEQKICHTPNLPTLGWPRHRDDGPIRRLVVFVGAVLGRRRPWSRSSLRLRESYHFETAFCGHEAVTAACHVTTEVAVLLTLYVGVGKEPRKIPDEPDKYLICVPYAL